MAVLSRIHAKGSGRRGRTHQMVPCFRQPPKWLAGASAKTLEAGVLPCNCNLRAKLDHVQNESRRRFRFVERARMVLSCAC